MKKHTRIETLEKEIIIISLCKINKYLYIYDQDTY